MPPTDRRRAVLDVVQELRHEWAADRASGLAAEIAFFGALSVFPALLVVAATLGSLGAVLGDEVERDARAEIIAQVQRLFGRGSSVEDAVASLFEGSNAGLFTVGVVVAIYSASRSFAAVVTALDLIADREQGRSWLRTRLLGLILAAGTLVVAAVAVTVFVVGPLFGRGPEIDERLGLASAFTTAWDIVRVPFTVVGLAAWATILYRVARQPHPPWYQEVPGAVIATTGGIAVTIGLRIYLDTVQQGDNAVRARRAAARRDDEVGGCARC